MANSNRFEVFTLDELHTMATALGNAIKHIKKESVVISQAEHGVQGYFGVCCDDNERLLREMAPAIKSKNEEAYPIRLR